MGLPIIAVLTRLEKSKHSDVGFTGAGRSTHQHILGRLERRLIHLSHKREREKDTMAATLKCVVFLIRSKVIGDMEAHATIRAALAKEIHAHVQIKVGCLCNQLFEGKYDAEKDTRYGLAALRQEQTLQVGIKVLRNTTRDDEIWAMLMPKDTEICPHFKV